MMPAVSQHRVAELESKPRESEGAMATVKGLAARLGAAQLLLSEHKGRAMHAAVSKAQAAAFVEDISHSELTPQEAADLMSKALTVPWFEGDAALVVNAFSKPGATNGLPIKRRRALQDFVAWHSYGTAEFWQAMESPAMPIDNKLQMLCQRCLKIGLRLPSEPTYKWMSSVWMLHLHSRESLSNMDAGQKSVYYKHLKATFDSLRRSAPEPAVWIDQLPSNPLDFCSSWPVHYKVCFPDGTSPAAPSLDLNAAIAFNHSFGCRGGSSRVVHFASNCERPQSTALALQKAPSHTDVVHVTSQRSEASSLERVANVVMQQMSAMASSQQRMLELVLGQQQHGQPGFLRSLTMEMPPQAPARSVQPLALPGPLVEEADTPTPPTTRRGAGPDVVAATTDDETLNAGSELEKLLGAWQSRKADNAIKAKANSSTKGKAKATAKVKAPPASTAEATKSAKAKDKLAAKGKIHPASKAKVTTPAEDDATHDAKATAKAKDRPASTPEATKAAKANDKLAAKAKTPPASKAKVAILAEDEAKHKAKATAKAKDRPTSTAETTEMAKAKDKPAKMAKIPPASKATPPRPAEAEAEHEEKATALVLGCSKCRWKVNGCAKCRSPSFVGTRWNSSMI
jgi:hypothetical protein